MRRRVRLAFLTLALGHAACGGGGTPPSAQPDKPAAPAWAATALAPALAPLAWMAGAWKSEGDASTETWTSAGGALVGVGFVVPGDATVAFEAMIIHRDRKDDRVVLTAMPGGQASVDFALIEQGADHATFSNPLHDFPQTIRYARDGAALTASVDGTGGEPATLRWTAAPRAPAPALEDADRAFAADTAADRIDAWVRWFDEAGAMWRNGRVEGHAAIREAMGPAFADPAFHLDWLPVASGLSAAGDLGFTVGRSTWPSDAGPVNGTYVSIWAPQPDGGWRVLFDAGTQD